PMARNRLWDAEKLSSHAPRIGAREPCASAATRRVEGPRAAAAVDRDGLTVLGLPRPGLDELAAFAARSAAADGGPVASAGISTLLGVEESAPIGSAHRQYGTPRSDSADECRQSSLGCARIHGELLKLGLAVSQAMVSIHAYASAGRRA